MGQVPQGRRPVQRVDDLCLRRALWCVAPLNLVRSGLRDSDHSCTACMYPVKFILLHEGRNDDGIRNFFLDVFEAWTKVRSMFLQPETTHVADFTPSHLCVRVQRSCSIRFSSQTSLSSRRCLTAR